jgi:hypothetical protein
MATNSKGTTYTIDFSTKEPTEIGSGWPDQETKKQTDQAVQKLWGRSKTTRHAILYTPPLLMCAGNWRAGRLFDPATGRRWSFMCFQSGIRRNDLSFEILMIISAG